MNEPTKRDKRHAALYFSPKNSKAYKELAARVRSDGGKTTLVWSNQWRGAESILTECRAIIVEEGCKNAEDIVEAYRRYAVNCEIHFADANGEFPEDAEGATDDEKEHDDQDTASDPVVEDAGSDAASDAGELDGDGEDAGTEDEGGEEGSEEPTDSTEPSID